MTDTDQDSFPKLNIPFLKNFSQTRWNFQDPSINGITLYHYHSKQSGGSHAIYAVVFELPPEYGKAKNLREQYEYFKENLRHAAEANDKAFYNKLLGIDGTFSSVYKDPPKDSDYLKEWVFFFWINGQPMPAGIMVYEPNVTLFKYVQSCDDGDPKVLTDEWQQDTALDAIRRGYIVLEYLVFLMAKEEQYNEYLPYLWHKFQCDLGEQKEPSIETAQTRIGVWLQLFYRWAFPRSGLLPRKKLNDEPLLPLCHYDDKTGKLEDYDRNWVSVDEIAYVKMEELKGYLSNTIGIPLPKSLFPATVGSQEALTQESLVNKSISHEGDILCEDSVRNLRVSVINDFEIQFREPKKKAISCNKDSLKIGPKVWKDFIEILQHPNNTYYVGDAKSQEYHRKQKRIAEMDKKLRDFFSREFSLNFPDGFKLYKKCHDECPGTYRFLFEIVKEVDKELDREKIATMEKLEGYSRLLKTTPPAEKKARARLIEQVEPLLKTAYQRGWITKEEAPELIQYQGESTDNLYKGFVYNPEKSIDDSEELADDPSEHEDFE